MCSDRGVLGRGATHSGWSRRSGEARWRARRLLAGRSEVGVRALDPDGQHEYRCDWRREQRRNGRQRCRPGGLRVRASWISVRLMMPSVIVAAMLMRGGGRVPTAQHDSCVAVDWLEHEARRYQRPKGERRGNPQREHEPLFSQHRES
jgi:hypothetical protein